MLSLSFRPPLVRSTTSRSVLLLQYVSLATSLSLHSYKYFRDSGPIWSSPSPSSPGLRTSTSSMPKACNLLYHQPHSPISSCPDDPPTSCSVEEIRDCANQICVRKLPLTCTCIRDMLKPPSRRHCKLHHARRRPYPGRRADPRSSQVHRSRKCFIEDNCYQLLSKLRSSSATSGNLFTSR